MKRPLYFQNSKLNGVNVAERTNLYRERNQAVEVV